VQTPDYASEAARLQYAKVMHAGTVYVLLALSAMLVSGGCAGKKINGLGFQLSPQLKAPCLNRLYVWQRPDPYFKDLRQVKRKGTLQYRRGRDVVANFPDSTTIIVELWQGLSGTYPPTACNPLPVFDPAKVKFHVEWRNDSRTVPAKGDFALAGKSGPQTWCEDKCVVHWTYKLSIDSQNVSLQDDIVLRLEAENGIRLAEYVGKLSAEDNQSLLPLPR
jgi:hypothetical protein